jgi:hypothetical protein
VLCCAVLCCVHLLDGDGGLPVFVFIEDAQAHGARGVDVGVEETTRELACARTSRGASSQHGSVLLQKNEASLRALPALGHRCHELAGGVHFGGLLG